MAHLSQVRRVQHLDPLPNEGHDMNGKHSMTDDQVRGRVKAGYTKHTRATRGELVTMLDKQRSTDDTTGLRARVLA